MKKLVGLLLLVIMILSMASVTMAATVYFDESFGGKLDNTATKLDYNPAYFGVNVPFGNWKISAEYNTGTWKWTTYDLDVTGYTVKGGYSFVNSKNVQLGLNVGLYYQKFVRQDGSNLSYRYDNDTTIGLDGSFKFSKHLKFDFSYDTLSSGKYIDTSNVTHDTDSLQASKAKLTYLLTENLGIALAYRSVIEQPKDGFFKFTSTATTAGVSFNF